MGASSLSAAFTTGGWSVIDSWAVAADQGSESSVGFSSSGAAGSASLSTAGTSALGTHESVFNGNELYSLSSTTWTFTWTGLANGEYNVAATWYQGTEPSNRAEAAPYTIQGILAPTVDQRLAPSGGPLLQEEIVFGSDALDDIQFQTIGTATVTDGTLTVSLSETNGLTGGLVMSGAVAIQAIPEPGSYALLAGLLGLSFVMLRRRK
jgi:hypothetical protein